MLRRALPALVAVLVVVFAAPAGAATKRPGTIKLAKLTLSGTVLSVSWKQTSGRIEVGIRTTVGTRTRTRIKGATGRSARLTTKVVGARGSALAASAVGVRVRRCAGSGKARRCGRWSTYRAPRATSAKVASPTAPPPAGDATRPMIGSCPMLPMEHAFNQDVSALPVDSRSAAYLASIGTGKLMHPDFGAADLGQGPGGFGIPYVVVPESQSPVAVDFVAYAAESDRGPYPIPAGAPIEGGPQSDGDRHVLVVQEGTCKLFEIGRAFPQAGGTWAADGGAIFDLRTGAPRPAGWTSADAAGLPILPGLAQYDEVAAGAIHHALRFTVSRSQRAYVAPASHWASTSTDQNAPPMGLRLRLRAGFDLSGFTGQALVIATALKRYGMIVADNGSDWYVSGAPDPRWNDDDLGQLKQVPGSAFEVVQTGAVVRP